MIVTTCTNWRQESGQAIGHRARGSLIRDSIWNWFIVFVLVRCRPCSQEMPSGINGKCLCLCLDFKCHIIWLGSITNLSGKRVTVIHFISYFYNDKKKCVCLVLYCKSGIENADCRRIGLFSPHVGDSMPIKPAAAFFCIRNVVHLSANRH